MQPWQYVAEQLLKQFGVDIRPEYLIMGFGEISLQQSTAEADSSKTAFG